MTQLKKPEYRNRIYIDSNVWFAYITEDTYEKEFFELAKNLIDDIIEDAESAAMISQLVHIEMLRLFRVKVTRKEECKGPLTEEIEAKIISKMNGFSDKFSEKITGWISSGKLVAIRPTRAYKEVFTDIEKLQRQIEGKIVYQEKGGKYNNPSDRYDYKVIDHFDIQHLVLAKHGKATHFATFDKGFKYVRNRFPELKFKVMEVPDETPKAT